jgi:hypothetical protein
VGVIINSNDGGGGHVQVSEGFNLGLQLREEVRMRAGVRGVDGPEKERELGPLDQDGEQMIVVGYYCELSSAEARTPKGDDQATAVSPSSDDGWNVEEFEARENLRRHK